MKPFVAVLVFGALLSCSGSRASSQNGNVSKSDASAESHENTFEARVQCAEEGLKRWNRDDNNRPEGAILEGPFFTYSPELNTCIYEYGFMFRHEKPPRSDWSIVDGLTNEDLAFYSGPAFPNQRSAEDGQAMSEFKKREQEFFHHPHSGLR